MVLGSFISLLLYLFSFAFVCSLCGVIGRKINRINIDLRKYSFGVVSRRKIEVFLLYFVLFSFLGLLMYARKDIGTDYHLYDLYFQQYANADFSLISLYGGVNTEIIPFIFVKIASHFTNGIHVFNLLCALFIYAFLLSSLLHYKKDGTTLKLMIFITLVLLFAPSMNIIRQIMAVSVIFWGIRFCLQRNFTIYIICCLIATMCHSSGVVGLLFLLFLIPKHKNKLFDNVVLVAVLLFPLFFSYLFHLMGNISIFSKYTTIYSGTVGFTFDYRYFLAKAPVIILLFCCKNQLEKRNENNRFFFFLFMVELSGILMGSWMEWAFRVMYYGCISEIILIPQIPDLFLGKNRKIIASFITLYYLLYFIIIHFYLGYDGIFPFSF